MRVFILMMDLPERIFDRPEMKRMLDDVDAGLIDCIVVKDLSRFGRERIETGTYIARTF